MTVRDRVLGTARGYQAWKIVTGGRRTMDRIVEQYVKVNPGDRVLDVGCGYGDLAGHLPGATYVGVDANPSYIRLARKVHPSSDTFIEASVTDLVGTELETFEVAVAVGLLHHLTDDDAVALLKALPSLLRPGGRFVAVEPVWHPDSQATARVLAALDRGRYVRDQRSYEQLVGPYFKDTTSEVRHDLFWFPYSHCILTSRP